MKEQLKFKTTINCGGCIASVSPSLNNLAGEGNWQVDTDNPSKILSVNADAASQEAVIEAVSKAGFKAEPLND